MEHISLFFGSIYKYYFFFKEADVYSLEYLKGRKQGRYVFVLGILFLRTMAQLSISKSETLLLFFGQHLNKQVMF